MSDWLQRIEKSIQHRCLLRRGQPVLVAVSGGLDSMALLQALHALAKEWRWRLVVTHFNHQLRGRSSNADEQLVRRTAAKLGLPIEVDRADVKRFAAQSKLSIEMAARKLRHEFLARAAKTHGVRTVALAHHADDQVELFFLRLLRGTSGEGLSGMKWRSLSPVDAKIVLVRPLLDFSKSELQEFGREHKIRFRQDATNFSADFLRNRIRNELLPLLRRKYQPALTKAVLRLMEIVGAEAEFVGEAASRHVGKSSRAPHLIPLPVGRGEGGRRPGEGKIFANLRLAVQRRSLQLQLTRLNVPPDFELVESLRVSANRPVSIGSELSVVRDAAGMVKLQTSLPVDFNANELTLGLSGRAGGETFDGLWLRWQTGNAGKFSRPRPQPGRELFDADKIGAKITLRYWRQGDRFRPIGMKSDVKLQDWFVNRKIPRAHRRKLVVATTASGRIFWIEGQRIGDDFKLTPQTKRRLLWRWRRSKLRKGQ